jgi:hypothetical protein
MYRLAHQHVQFACWRGAELLFQVLTEREEKASVAIASNESFSWWTKTFTDPRPCAAIADRLTFGGNASRPAATPIGWPKLAPASSTPPTHLVTDGPTQ